MRISKILSDKENLELLIQKFPDLEIGTLQDRYFSSKVCCNAYELIHRKNANSICVEFFYLDDASGLKVYSLYGETSLYIGYGTSTDAFFCNTNLEDLQEAFENMNLPSELVAKLLDDISKRLKNDSDLTSYLIKNQLSYKMLENGSIKIENSTISLKTLLEIQDLMKIKLEISVSNPKYSDFILTPVEEQTQIIMLTQDQIAQLEPFTKHNKILSLFKIDNELTIVIGDPNNEELSKAIRG